MILERIKNEILLECGFILVSTIDHNAPHSLKMAQTKHLLSTTIICILLAGFSPGTSADLADSALAPFIADMLEHRDSEFLRSLVIAHQAADELALTLAQLLTHAVIGETNDAVVQLKAQKAIRQFGYNVWRIVIDVHNSVDGVLACGEQKVETFLGKSRLLRPIACWLRREHENLWRAQDRISGIVAKSIRRLEHSLVELVNRALRYERRGDGALIVTAVAEIKRTIRAHLEKTKEETLAVLHGEGVVKRTNWRDGIETECKPEW